MQYKKKFKEMIGKVGGSIPLSLENNYSPLSSNDQSRYNNIKNHVFLIGFQKTATSSLAGILFNHHDICLPTKKEPFFYWTDEYKFGMDFYWKKYFPHYNGQNTILDATTSMSYIPYCAERLYNTLPNSKIIIGLRNPIDRAYSNWWMYKCSGEENLTFEEAVKWELKELKLNLIPYEDPNYWEWYVRRQVSKDFYIRRRTVRTYLTRSYYAIHIKRYLNYFPKHNIHFLFQEDMKKNKFHEIEKVLSFIDLNYKKDIKNIYEETDYHTTLNSLRLSALKRKYEFLANYIPKGTINIIKNLLKLIDSKIKKTQMPISLRQELISFYKDKNSELSKLIDVDLSHWK